MVRSSTAVMVSEYTSLEIAINLPVEFVQFVSFLPFKNQIFAWQRT